LQVLSIKNTIKDKNLTPRDMQVLTSASNKLRLIGANMRGKTEIASAVTDQIILTAKTLEKYFGQKPTEEREDLKALDSRVGSNMRAIEMKAPEWCAMSIIKAKLDRSVSRLRLGTRRKAGFLGAFRNPLRALLPAFDGMAWDRKLPSIGGNILIDMSSSMKLQPSEIAGLLATAPAATIAGYASDSQAISLIPCSRSNAWAGALSIIFSMSGPCANTSLWPAR
jgi:hypothetical protein